MLGRTRKGKGKKILNISCVLGGLISMRHGSLSNTEFIRTLDCKQQEINLMDLNRKKN